MANLKSEISKGSRRMNEAEEPSLELDIFGKSRCDTCQSKTILIHIPDHSSCVISESVRCPQCSFTKTKRIYNLH